MSQSTISAPATMLRLCLGLGLSKSLQGQLWRSAQCQAALPHFQWTSQALLGGLSAWRGPLVLPPLPALPPPPPLPPLPPPRLFRRGGLVVAAATSVAASPLARAATTEVLAALEAQTLSALSKTSCQVAESNAMSAMEVRTIEGKPRLHIPSTVPAQFRTYITHYLSAKVGGAL